MVAMLTATITARLASSGRACCRTRCALQKMGANSAPIQRPGSALERRLTRAESETYHRSVKIR